MKTITITLGTKVNTTKADDNAPWYVRAETSIKEGLRETKVVREVATQTRAALREELDAMYVEKAKAQMTALMAKRGLIVKFN